MTEIATVLARIEQRLVTDTATGCKLWQGALSREHGVIKVDGQQHQVHRFVWQAANGRVPPDQFVLHKCGVSNCVNLDHLALGDRLENAADRQRHGRYVGPFPSQSRVVRPKLEKFAKVPEAPLSQAEVKRVLDYDPETGVFMWKARPDRDRTWNTRFAGQPTGTVIGLGYRYIKVCGKLRLAHRLAWLYMTGEMPPHQVDHINRDKADNRWANLRLATNAENHRNEGLRSTNTSGHKGVSWDKKARCWRAMITTHGKQTFLGFSDTIEGAVALRAKAEAAEHGHFAADAATDSPRTTAALSGIGDILAKIRALGPSDYPRFKTHVIREAA